MLYVRRLVKLGSWEEGGQGGVWCEQALNEFASVRLQRLPVIEAKYKYVAILLSQADRNIIF